MQPSGSYVGRPCPKCAYVRNINDADKPPGQCPRCEEPYPKGNPDAPPARAAGGMSTRQAVQAEPYVPLAILAHGSLTLGLFFPMISMLIPIVLIFTQKDDDLVIDSAKEALNFYITFLLVIILGVFLIFIIGGLASLFIAAAMIGYLVMPIIAMVRTSSDKELYVYPYIWHPLGNFT